MEKVLDFQILPQPDDYSCGPTCLHSVYRFFNDTISLDSVISEVGYLEGGGTLAVQLGNHALRKGYRATIFTYNLQVFDPTWFSGQNPDYDLIREKLSLQEKGKEDPRLSFATESYREFLNNRGLIHMETLTGRLIRHYLNRSIPILTGLSSTYLYMSMREYHKDGKDIDNDILGVPQGHFVVLAGYDRNQRKVLVADPYKLNPVGDGHYYLVDIDRLLNSILLGILTYDANLLVVEPPAGSRRKGRS